MLYPLYIPLEGPIALLIDLATSFLPDEGGVLCISQDLPRWERMSRTEKRNTRSHCQVDVESNRDADSTGLLQRSCQGYEIS